MAQTIPAEPLTGEALLKYVKEAPKDLTYDQVIRGAGYVSVRRRDGKDQECVNRTAFNTELQKAQGLTFQGMETNVRGNKSRNRVRISPQGILPISRAYTSLMANCYPGTYMMIEHDPEEDILIISRHEDQQAPTVTAAPAAEPAAPAKPPVKVPVAA